MNGITRLADTMLGLNAAAQGNTLPGLNLRGADSADRQDFASMIRQRQQDTAKTDTSQNTTKPDKAAGSSQKDTNEKVGPYKSDNSRTDSEQPVRDELSQPVLQEQTALAAALIIAPVDIVHVEIEPEQITDGNDMALRNIGPVAGVNQIILAPQGDSYRPTNMEFAAPDNRQEDFSRETQEIIHPQETQRPAESFEQEAAALRDEASVQEGPVIIKPEEIGTAQTQTEQQGSVLRNAAQPIQVQGPVQEQVSATEDETDIVPEEVISSQVFAGTPVFEQTDSTPVKVADPQQQPVELEAEDAPQQLAGRIEELFVDESGNRSIEVTLVPESLGKIVVQLSQSASGEMHLVLTATTQKAAELIDRNSGSLQNLLSGYSKSNVEVEVRAGEETARQFLNPNQDNQQQQQQQQQQQRRRDDQQEENRGSVDFLQQLRLGLVDLDS